MNRHRIPQSAYLRIRAAYVCIDSDSDSSDEGEDEQENQAHMAHNDSDAAVGAGRCAACV
jgi:hypothetical protein